MQYRILEDLLQTIGDGKGPNEDFKEVTKSCLAAVYVTAKRWKDAMQILESQNESGQFNEKGKAVYLLQNMESMASCYKNCNQAQKAIPIYTKIIEMRSQLNGRDHGMTHFAVLHCAEAYRQVGEFSKALECYDSIADYMESFYQSDNAGAISFYGDVALTYSLMAQPKKGVVYSEKAFSLATRALGPKHRRTLGMMYNLFRLYNDSGRSNEAISLAEQTYIEASAVLGDRDDLIERVRFNLAGMYFDKGRNQDAVNLLEKVSAVMSEGFSESDPTRQKSIAYLGWGYLLLGRHADSIRVLEEARKLPANKKDVRFDGYLGVAYAKVGRFEESIPLLEKARDAFNSQPYPAHFFEYCNSLMNTYGALKRDEEFKKQVMQTIHASRVQFENDEEHGRINWRPCGTALFENGYMNQAESILRKCLTIREKILPDDWRTFNTSSMLGECVLQKNKLSEAEAMLLSGYEGMERRIVKMTLEAKRIRLIPSIKRLVDLYTRMNNLDKVDEWTKKLADAQTAIEAEESATSR